MEKPKKRLLFLISGVVVLMLGLIGGIALAQDATPEAETPAQESDIPGSNDSTDERRMTRLGGFGRFGGDSNWLENLAEALGITVDQLEEAQEQAYAATVADAVAAGEITQEQADQILATRALKDYVNRQAVLATALGMTEDEWEAARAAGQSISDLMAEKGIDEATLQANARAAYEAAVQQAVADGVITQAQADKFLSDGGLSLFGHGGRGGHHGGGRGGRGGREFGWPAPDSTTPDATTPETTDTSFDA